MSQNAEGALCGDEYLSAPVCEPEAELLSNTPDFYIIWNTCLLTMVNSASQTSKWDLTSSSKTIVKTEKSVKLVKENRSRCSE